MHLFFMLSDIGEKSGVGGLANFWHGVPWDEVGFVCVTLAIILDTLGKAGKLPLIGRVPVCSVGSV